MKIIIKVLKGQDCTLDVETTDTIFDVKNKIKATLNIPIPSQKLLYLGRPLNDKSSLGSIQGFKDGFKFNLIVAQKPELQELLTKSVHKVFRKQYNDAMADKLTREFIRIYNSKFNQFSLDDLERFSEQL